MSEPSGWQLAVPLTIAFLAFGYLLGSIPFGLLITRFAGLGDVRKIGSGNIGATNVLRTGRKGLAAATLILDALKGTAAVLIAGMHSPEAAMAAGFGAFVGHLYPVWLGFKGGKGVATFLGVLIGLSWPAALGFAVAWLTIAFVTRYSSLAALAASLVVPIDLFFLGHTAYGIMFTVMTVLVFYKHRANISRLLAGTEARIGGKE